MMVEVNYSLARLSEAMQKYALLSDHTESGTIVKQAGKFAYNLRFGLRALAPAKGAVRLERLAALKSGREKGAGTKVRPAVMQELYARFQATTSIATGETFYAMRRGKTGRGKIIGMSREVKSKLTGKMINITALAVEAELNVRESARGFAGYSAKFRSYGEVVGRGYESEQSIFSRYGFVLAVMGLQVAPNAQTKKAEFTWLPSHGQYASAVAGLTKEKQQQVLLWAIEVTTADIVKYLKDHMLYNAESTGLN